MDEFESDPLLIESMRSETEIIGTSSNAIATEKLSSPTVIRNKHIKTMT